MESNQILAKYLVERGVNEPKVMPTRDKILKDENLLAMVAGLNLEALKALVQARVDEAREELVMRAHPAEVFVLRQVMLELTAVLDDQASYAEEYTRRQQQKDQPAPEVAPNPEDSSVNQSSA